MPVVLFVAQLSLSFACSQGPGNAGEDKRPNIIIIITDDQHRDQFNYLPEGQDETGKPLNLTPNLDRLASEGVILDQCYVSTSVCTPSRYSVLSGTYASRARNENFLEDARRYQQTNVHWNVDLIPGTYNIARVLSEQGYFTGGVGKNHVIAGKTPYRIPREADPSDPGVKRKLIARSLQKRNTRQRSKHIKQNVLTRYMQKSVLVSCRS